MSPYHQQVLRGLNARKEFLYLIKRRHSDQIHLILKDLNALESPNLIVNVLDLKHFLKLMKKFTNRVVNVELNNAGYHHVPRVL